MSANKDMSCISILTINVTILVDKTLLILVIDYFDRGGRNLTVKGNYLTSVFAPYLEITMKYNGTMKVFSNVSTVYSSASVS